MRLLSVRRLPQAAREELRRRAVVLVAQGQTQVEVARPLEVSRQSAHEWVAAHRRGGEEAMRDMNSDQLRLSAFLLTPTLVCELIERRFGFTVTEKTAGRHLRVWWFSPQKPAPRAFEQTPDTVRAWIEARYLKRYPKIETRAYREKARILWADEMGLHSDHIAGRS